MEKKIHLSKGFYLGFYFGGVVLATIMLFVGIAMVANEIMAGIAFLVLAFLLWLFIMFIIMMLYYKMWAAIQDGHARTTPGKAVGFMFIPFFNLYWMFQAIWGFSVDYNAYIERHSIETQPLPAGLFLTFCILSLAGAIPYIGIIVSFASIVIFIIMVLKICDAVNILPAEPQKSLSEYSA